MSTSSSNVVNASSASLFIRKARRKDRVGMKECNERNLAENYGLDFWEKSLDQYPGKSLVLTDKSHVIHGYIFGNGKMIISFSVDKHLRRQGLGRRLLETFLQDSAEGDVSLHVRASNDGAKKLYQSLGFTSKQKIPNYYQSPQEDGELMVRSSACVLTELAA